MSPLSLRIRALVLSLAIGASLPVWAAEPAPAVVTKVEVGAKTVDAKNSFAKAFVTKETLDGIEFLVDDPKGQNKLSLKRGTYTVKYDLTSDVDLLTGLNNREAANFAKAADAFAKAVAGNKRYVISTEWALRYGAEVALKAGKADDALAQVAQLEKTEPRSLLLVEALVIRAQAQAAKGDTAGATKTYAGMVAMAKDFGNSSRIRGIRGQASLQAAAKQPGEAAKTLAALFATLDPAKDSADYGDTALELLGYQIAANQTDAALATVVASAYVVSDPVDLSQLQLHWANLLAAKGTTASLQEAFDHAAIACGVKGAPQATVTAANGLARQLVDKLQKDASLSAEDKLEYRKCVENL